VRAAPSTTPTPWSLSRNWVLILKELRSLPPSSMCTLSVNFAAKLVHTSRALSSTVINSHQEPVSGRVCNPLDPHWFFLFAVEELYGTRYQSGSFSLINVGSGFHCLRSFSFLTQPAWCVRINLTSTWIERNNLLTKLAHTAFKFHRNLNCSSQNSSSLTSTAM